jgi:hypothetical protein
MNEVFFVCDESGAMGFADRPEQAVKAIGLLAGVIVPKAAEIAVRNKLGSIAANCPPSADGKLHITGLGEAESDALRKEVFQLIKDQKLNCVYSATAVEGFHASFQQLKTAEASAVAAKPAHIVDNNPRLKPDRLHADLFQDAFGVVTAWCEEKYGEKVETTVHVRTDPVDARILHEFRAAAAELTGAALGWTQQLKFYDKLAKKPLTTEISTKFEGAGAYGPASHIKYTVQVDSVAFTLLADVVANSLFDHIRKRFAAGGITDLNGTAAVEGHDLAGFIYGLNMAAGVPRLSDVVHRHPGLELPVTMVDVTVEDISDGETLS